MFGTQISMIGQESLHTVSIQASLDRPTNMTASNAEELESSEQSIVAETTPTK